MFKRKYWKQLKSRQINLARTVRSHQQRGSGGSARNSRCYIRAATAPGGECEERHHPERQIDRGQIQVAFATLQVCKNKNRKHFLRHQQFDERTRLRACNRYPCTVDGTARSTTTNLTPHSEIDNWFTLIH